MDIAEKIEEEEAHIASMTRTSQRFPRNYVAEVVTSKVKGKEVMKVISASRYESYPREIGVTIVFIFLVGISAGAMIWGGEILASKTGWNESLVVNSARVLAGIWIILVTYHIAPTLSILGGLMGQKLVLLPDDKQDQKLAVLIQRHSGMFSTEWFKQWAEGNKDQRDEIYRELLSLGNRYKAASTKLHDLKVKERRRKRDRRKVK